MAEKLPQSRFQRHLSDSTIARNFGTLLGFVLLALENSASDIRDFEPKLDVIKVQLENRWGIVTSGIQSRLRLLGVTDAYERFDALAKQGPITKERLHACIDEFAVPEEEKAFFKSLRPETYIGDAEELTDNMVLEIRTSLSTVLHR